MIQYIVDLAIWACAGLFLAWVLVGVLRLLFGRW
jgi:hypothetical protein